MRQEELAVDGGTIPYTLVRSRRRHRTIAITIDRAGAVVVRAPWNTSGAHIRAVLQRRAGWVLRQRESPPPLPRARALITGEQLPYLGMPVALQVKEGPTRRSTVTLTADGLRVSVPEGLGDEERRALLARALERWFRARAQEVLAERTRVWSVRTGLEARRVLIRNQRRRWASCSSDGTLRFNWRLVMAPLDLIDYVVVHELAHLRVPNHSADFWNEVEQVLPDYAARRARMRGIGTTLDL